MEAVTWLWNRQLIIFAKSKLIPLPNHCDFAQSAEAAEVDINETAQDLVVVSVMRVN